MSIINPLTETFSSIVQNITNYENVLGFLSEVFTSTIKNIDEKQFLSVDFLDYYQKYPKYNLDFKPINTLNKYNLVTIYNIAQNDLNLLIESIEDINVLNLKIKTDQYSDINVRDDYYLQTCFFTKMNELINPTIYSGFLTDSERQTYIYKTFGYYVNQNTKESSLTFLYILYVFLIKNLKNYLKIFETSYDQNYENLQNNTEYSTFFSEYLNTNSLNLSTNLVKFILAYTYKITNPSGSFLKNIVDIVQKKLITLPTIVNNYFKIIDSISANLLLNTTNYLYHVLTSQLLSVMNDPSLNIISTETIQVLREKEIKLIDPILKNYTAQSIRDYLYLVYYYKLNPKKFLNVLQTSLVTYTKQKLINYDENIFNLATLQNTFHQLAGTINSSPPKSGINFDAIGKILKITIQPEIVSTVLNDTNVIAFSTRMTMIEYFELIFNSTNSEFELFLDDLYESIFAYLKNTVQIEPYYEYFFNRKMIQWYLCGCFKRDILNNKIFAKAEILISEILDNILENQEKYIYNIEKMRSRTVQFLEGNINNIGNFFENVLETSIEKKLHNEHIAYFLN